LLRDVLLGSGDMPVRLCEAFDFGLSIHVFAPPSQS